MSRRRMCRAAVVIVVAVALALLLLPTVALAANGDSMVSGGLSSTNPGEGDMFWRDGWGSSLKPDITIESTATGFYYWVDRTDGTWIDTSTPDAYFHATLGDGTHLTHIIDLASTYAYPPLGGWPAWEPGMQEPLEGTWYYHLAPYAQDASANVVYWGRQGAFVIRVDRHAPAPVRNVRVTAHPSVPASTTAVSSGSRVTVKWDGVDTDPLSGVAYYSLFVDGEKVLAGGPDGTHTTPGSSPFWLNPDTSLPYAVTIEDLSPGRHLVDMTCTDKALNESGKSVAAIFYSDPDTPTVSIAAPANAMLTKSATLSAIATDLAGVQDVTFVLDNTLLGVVTKPADAVLDRYDLGCDFGAFASGAHTLAVSARDMYGRVVTVTKVVTLDKVVPVISKVSQTPNPFCPILRDKYKDNSVVTFTVSEKSTMSLYIYDANKKLVQTLSSVRNAGTSSFTWNGKKANGTVTAGRYYYVLGAVDSAGNSARTGYFATRIISYELKKVARNKVVVVPR